MLAALLQVANDMQMVPTAAAAAAGSRQQAGHIQQV